MEKVVVTGAAGFIGSHVANELEKRGYEVLRSDIRRPPAPNNGWRLADLTNLDDMTKLTQGAAAVCHIGGIGDIYQAIRDPTVAMNVNAGGTATILEASNRNSVERFIYASTWEVYGQPHYEPIDELHPCRPGHPYSVSKLAGDLITQAYRERGSMTTVVLRLGTTYGPQMRANAVIPSFVLRALSGQPIEIQGTGSQSRQFTHVTDVAQAFALAIEAADPSAAYNIVAPERTSIRELAQLIDQRIPLKMTTGSPRPNDVPPALVDSRIAVEHLGWKPSVRFRRGLNELIDFYVQSQHDDVSRLT